MGRLGRRSRRGLCLRLLEQCSEVSEFFFQEDPGGFGKLAFFEKRFNFAESLLGCFVGDAVELATAFAGVEILPLGKGLPKFDGFVIVQHVS